MLGQRLRRGLLIAVMALVLPAPAAAGQDDPATATFTYQVEVRGQVVTDVDDFATTVDRILEDARGWSLGGSVTFTRVTRGADFNVVLASPEEVAEADEECGPDYSCRVDDDVLINDRNWREMTEEWEEAGAKLWLYRQYVVNHEVGHYLGFGHEDCPGEGEAAPVMQQQSMGLEGCEPNAWPLERERDILAYDLDVPVHERPAIDFPKSGLYSVT